jgi:hypothetical protein
MICPTCQAEGLTSTVTTGGASTTLAGYPRFYDEQGNLHHHDNNDKVTKAQCSNGHRFRYQYPNKCWCGWEGSKEKYTPLS